MVKLDNFGVNPRASAVGHYQAVEAKHHAGAAFDLAGHVDLRDVSVHTCIPVFARVNNRCAERIADLGINARQRVVQTNPERGVLRHLKCCGLDAISAGDMSQA